MCRAIAAAYAVDEVKSIRDKARAFEVYAQQAQNTEAERQACEIRLRAERKAGEILAKRIKANGDRGTPSNQHQRVVGSHDVTPPTLAEMGVTKKQSADWQKLAAVPEDWFEATLATPGPKPTTAGIIAAHTEPKPSPVDDRALWLWGQLKDFERLWNSGRFGAGSRRRWC